MTTWMKSVSNLLKPWFTEWPFAHTWLMPMRHTFALLRTQIAGILESKYIVHGMWRTRVSNSIVDIFVVQPTNSLASSSPSSTPLKPIAEHPLPMMIFPLKVKWQPILEMVICRGSQEEEGEETCSIQMPKSCDWTILADLNLVKSCLVSCVLGVYRHPIRHCQGLTAVQS